MRTQYNVEVMDTSTGESWWTARTADRAGAIDWAQSYLAGCLYPTYITRVWEYPQTRSNRGGVRNTVIWDCRD